MQKCSNYDDKMLSILSPKPEANFRILKKPKWNIFLWSSHGFLSVFKNNFCEHYCCNQWFNF